MISPDNLDQLEQCAKSALARMVELGIPLSSSNYMVWYSYFVGNDSDLMQEIDSLLGKDVKFDDRLNEQLYAKFFGRDDQKVAVHGAMSDLESLVGRLVSFVGETQERAADYGRLLDDAGQRLANQDGDQLDQVLDLIRSETLKVAEAFGSAETKLAETNGHLTRIGGDLEKAEKEIYCDDLTGIANWKAFHDALRRCAIMVSDIGGPISLLMLDLDHLERFNDQHGRQIGDRLLALAARILTKGVPADAIAARYSGGEFAVILPGLSISQATALAESIKDTFALHEMVKRHSGERIGPVTISIGVAGFRNTESLAHFIQRTRRAMQVAKTKGRNRVEIDEADANNADPSLIERQAS